MIKNISNEVSYEDKLVRPEGLIVMIGCEGSRTVELLRKTFPYCKIEVYDPLIENISAVQNIPMVDANLAAVGDIKGKGTFGTVHVLDRKDATTLEVVPPKYKVVENRSVIITPFDNVIDHLGDEIIDLLLIDCEGGELHIIERIIQSTSIRRRVRQFCVEWHCVYRGFYPTKMRTDLATKLEEYYWYIQMKDPQNFLCIRKDLTTGDILEGFLK